MEVLQEPPIDIAHRPVQKPAQPPDPGDRNTTKAGPARNLARILQRCGAPGSADMVSARLALGTVCAGTAQID